MSNVSDVISNSSVMQNLTDSALTNISPPVVTDPSIVTDNVTTPIFSDPVNAGNVLSGIDGNTVIGNATNASTTSGPLFGNFSWQALVIFGILAVVVLVLIIFAWKRPKSNNQNQSSNAYLKALIIALSLAFLVFIMEGMGWLNEGTAKYGIPLYILLFLILVWKFSNPRNEMLEKITKRYVIMIRKHLMDWYNVEPIVGNKFGSQIPYFIVKINNGEYGGGDIDVVHYLMLTNQQKYYAVTVGLQTDSVLDTIEDPSPEYIEKTWRKIPKPSPASINSPQTTPSQSNQSTPQPNVQPS